MSASVSDDRSRSAARRKRAGREHPREVGTRRRGAPPVADPLHPVRRVGHEVLRCRLHQLDALRHRQGEEPDQSHVVVQRQPRHHHLVGRELGGFADGVDVGAQDAVGDHHALRLARRARLVYCRMTSRSGSSGGSSARRPTGRPARPGAPTPIGSIGGSPGAGLVERRRADRRSSTSLASPWRMRARVPSMNASSEPIRIGRGSTMMAMPANQQPLDDRDQLAARRPEDRDVIAGHEPSRLQRGADGAGLVVDLRPRTMCAGPSGPITDEPTNRTPVARSAAASRRAMVESAGVTSTDASAGGAPPSGSGTGGARAPSGRTRRLVDRTERQQRSTATT